MKISVAGLPLLVLPFLTGCVSSGYQKASPDMPPAFPLRRDAGTADLGVRLESLIGYGQPGSWKRHAYWDEYILTFRNTSRGGISIEGVELVDRAGQRFRPGDDWAKLERESVDWAKRSLNGQNLARGTVLTVLGTGAGASMLLTFGALMGAPVLLPVAAGGLLVTAGAGYLVDAPNEDSRRYIDEEFARRRLALPAAVGRHTELHGSLFFRMGVEPEWLLVRYRSSSGPGEVRLHVGDLK